MSEILDFNTHETYHWKPNSLFFSITGVMINSSAEDGLMNLISVKKQRNLQVPLVIFWLILKQLSNIFIPNVT